MAVVVISGTMISPRFLKEIMEFINTHAITTFDQWVDYPSPIYTVIWRGEKFVSREKDYLAMEILEFEVKRA
jgi:hypothetical protein